MKLEGVWTREMPYLAFAAQSLGNEKAAVSLRTTASEQSILILSQEGAEQEQLTERPEGFLCEKRQLFSRLKQEDYATCKEYTLFETQEVNLSIQEHLRKWKWNSGK